MANILVIDDDRHVGGLLENHLRDEGYNVRVVHRGDDGVAAANLSTPDLILLDVMLPDATGYQICNRLRQIETIQKVPIFMMSGVARYSNQKIYAMERGANEYLVKPFQIFEVGDLVNSYLRKPATPLPKEPEATPPPQPPEEPVDSSPAVDEAGLKELHSYLQQAIENKNKKKRG